MYQDVYKAIARQEKISLTSNQPYLSLIKKQ